MKTEHPSSSVTGCRVSAHVVAWLQGELTASEAENLVDHVRGCAACRAFTADARALLEGLGAEPMRVHGRSGLGWGLAAVAASMVMGLVWWGGWAKGPGAVPLDLPTHAGAMTPITRPESVSEALHWVEVHQRVDGSWSDPIGADAVARNALALVALARGAQETRDASVAQEQVRRAAGWLVDGLGPDGDVSRGARGAFDRPLVALALVEAWGVTGDEALWRAADGALAHLVREGSSAPARVNAGSAAWMMEALERAEGLGWEGLEPVLARLRAGAPARPARSPRGDFWTVALGRPGPPRDAPVRDLASASLAVLASADP